MDIIDTLKKERHGIPIHFQEFKEIGMTEKEFLYYLQLCERIRSCAIIFDSDHGISQSGVSVVRANSNSKKWTSLETLGNTMLHRAIEELLAFLQQYSDKSFSLERPSLKPLYDSCTYRFDLSKCELPYYYTFLEDYRAVIERYIKKCMLGEDIEIQSSIKKAKTKSVKDVNRRINHINEELNYLSSVLNDDELQPMPSEGRIESHLALLHWAEKQRDFAKKVALQKELAELKRLQSKKAIPQFKQGEHTLYIYGSKGIYCKKEKHDIVSVTCHITLANGKKAVINAEYCRDCNKFLLYEDTYNRYRKEFMFLPLILFYVNDSTYRSMYTQQFTLKEKSPLGLIGYSVSADKNYSPAQRRQLLIFIIESKILSKQKVIEYLEFFINFNEGRKHYVSAVEKWVSDLEYIQSYNIENQLQANINQIERYKK